MSLLVRSDATSGEAFISINGTERFKLDVDGNLVLLNSAARVLIGSTPMMPTGAFLFFQLAAPPEGWIVGNGGSIGAPTSNATTRAHNDTFPLYVAWWNAYTNAQLPVLTSAGVPTSRGLNAGADWDANKRLTVFDARDRVPRAAGTIQANGAKLEATQIGVAYTDGPGSTGVVPAGNQQVVNGDGPTSQSVTYSTWAVSPNAAGALPYNKVRAASLGMLGCYKL